MLKDSPADFILGLNEIGGPGCVIFQVLLAANPF